MFYTNIILAFFICRSRTCLYNALSHCTIVQTTSYRSPSDNQTFAAILLCSSYELIFTKSFSDVDERSGVICVTEFPLNYQSLWTILHQIISIGHFLLPLLIHICSTCTIIGAVTKTKVNLHRGRKCEFFLSIKLFFILVFSP